MGAAFSTILLVTLGLLLVSAGIQDARTREIANWKNAVIALAAPLWWWANGLALWPDVAIQVGIAAALFGACVLAFAIGQMGGGDVKLLGALGLWLPMQPLASMLMTMALLGGGLTLLMIADQWVRRREGLSRPGLIVIAAAVLLAACVAIVMLVPAGPLMLLAAAMTAVGAIGILMLSAVKAARRRGIQPEVPYGVAIAIATLLILREPIFNQFG